MRDFVAGGAGFIGSHLVRRLIERPGTGVVVYDNLSGGRSFDPHTRPDDTRVRFVQGDLKDLDALKSAIACDTDVVFLVASNPDIARAALEPDIDFWEGTYLVQNVLEAMRLKGVGRVVYA
jgi:UDP-glucose 4-epimerase